MSKFIQLSKMSGDAIAVNVALVATAWPDGNGAGLIMSVGSPAPIYVREAYEDVLLALTEAGKS